MASGRKRFRPPLVDADADSTFHEDDLPSNKFARVRTRTRVPTRVRKAGGGGVVSHSWAGESAASRFGGSSASIDAAGKNRVFKTAVRTSTGSEKGRSSTGGPGGNESPAKSGNSRGNNGRPSTGSLPRKSDEGKQFPKVKTGQKPRPRKWLTGSPAFRPAASSSPQVNTRKPSFTPKRKPATPRQKGPVPSTSYGLNTPEYMKIKEEDSIIEEKKERKRRRNKVLSLKTSRGQPLMRGRIELMLDEIKANMTQ